jgi:hypothetical protein
MHGRRLSRIFRRTNLARVGLTIAQSDQRDYPCSQDWRAVARLSERLWTAHDDLQPLQSMVAPYLVVPHPRCTRRQGRVATREFDRLDLYKSASLDPRRKRGAKAQAIGPSRGGQTTKIHVVTDLLGRPVTLHLTPGPAMSVTSRQRRNSSISVRRPRPSSPTKVTMPIDCVPLSAP